MVERTCLAIVLAAGEGTRMRSARPRCCTRSPGGRCSRMCSTAVRAAGGIGVAVVVGPDADAVRAEATRECCRARKSSCRRSAAAPPMRCWPRKAAIARGADDVLVIFGDTPLIRPQTLRGCATRSRSGAAIAVLGFRPKDPTGYGRLVLEGGELVAIREELDASAGRARHRSVQWRADGVRRRDRAGDPQADRQRQPQGRILSDRRDRDRAGDEAARRS